MSSDASRAAGRRRGELSGCAGRIALMDPFGKLQRFDRASITWLAARRSPGRDRLFILGSYTGAKGVPWSALLMLLRVRARGGERISPRRGVAITIGTWAAAHACKRLDHRRRPCQDGDAAPLVPCPKSSSLPSDEAACAFAAATYASSRLPRLSLPLYLAAAFTAVSRVYVGAHYPTDVAAGGLLGAIVARACS
jgi:undecaprenyl-diphosphatase